MRVLHIAQVALIAVAEIAELVARGGELIFGHGAVGVVTEAAVSRRDGAMLHRCGLFALVAAVAEPGLGLRQKVRTGIGVGVVAGGALTIVDRTVQVGFTGCLV